MSEIVILAVCFQLKQLKKQPEKKFQTSSCGKTESVAVVFHVLHFSHFPSLSTKYSNKFQHIKTRGGVCFKLCGIVRKCG